MTLAAITTFPKTTHKINTGETSSDYSVKLSLSPHKSSNGTFLDSHSGFIQDPGCKPDACQVKDLVEELCYRNDIWDTSL